MKHLLQSTLFHRLDDVGPNDAAVHGVLRMLRERQLPTIAAVIPQHLESATSRMFRERPGIAVFQHGYAHINRARPSGYSDEFPSHLPQSLMRKELGHGKQMLQQAIGAPIVGYVPPWNKTSGVAHQVLEELGFQLFSGNQRYRPRTSLQRLDISVDMVLGCSPVRFRPIDHVMDDLREAMSEYKQVGLMYHVQRTGDKGVQFVEKLLNKIERELP